ncbi:Pectin lyase fold/virulence factor [Sesbania bispinosa]|nr:Pectin lyase fold/virulence factor [Sesbania bispinosa]
MKNFTCCSFSTFIIVFIHINLLLSSFLTNAKGFDSVIQLPHSYGLTRSKRVLSVSDYGAKGDGLHNDTKAFQEAWNIACAQSGRIYVMVPPGKSFLVHPVDFAGPCRSKITLTMVEEESMEWDSNGGPDLARSTPQMYGSMEIFLTSPFLFKVNNMCVLQKVTSKCPLAAMSTCSNAEYEATIALQAINFHRCKNLKVRNLMVLNSQKMHMAFTSCKRVVASHLQVLAPAFSPNTDGIHISATKGIEVKDSLIRTGDDCISIVRNSSRIRIRDISCGPGHGISIGSLGKSKAWEKVQDVHVKGAYLYNTDNGVRIKTWQGGGGFASKIKFQNILMENVSNPIIIDQYYCDSRHPCKNQTSGVKVESISFIDIRGTSATEEAIKFACSDTFPCEGLYLKNIYLVPCFGGVSKSYCWKAHGSTQGLVYPPACFTSNNDFIRQKVWLESNHAFIPSEQTHSI